MVQRFVNRLASPLKWGIMVVGLVFILLLIDVALDLHMNPPIDARDAHFLQDERTFPSPDGSKLVTLVAYHTEPRYTTMMLDLGRSGCGIFHYPDTGLARTVLWPDNEHVKIIGPDSLRSGLNMVNDTCQSSQRKVYISFEAH